MIPFVLHAMFYNSATRTVVRDPVPGRGDLVTVPRIDTRNLNFVGQHSAQCVNMCEYGTTFILLTLSFRKSMGKIIQLNQAFIII